MTYRELVYLVLDGLKLISDDSHFTEEHVAFLLGKYRAFLLKQRYSDIRKDIPESNYQTICVDVEKYNSNSCNKGYLRSVHKIPHTMEIGNKRITPTDMFSGNINYVSNARFKYVGSSKYSSGQIFGTIAPDHYLYLKSDSDSAYYLEKVRITGIFEDLSEVFKYRCDDSSEESGVCDIMDMSFPLEESLVTPMLQMAMQELSGLRITAADSKNNANDDLSDIAQYIRQQLALGRRSELYNNP